MNKSRIFLAILLLITALSVEVGSYLASKIFSDLYDYREDAVAGFSEGEYADFLKYAADADLGWDQSTNPDKQISPNCKGVPTSHTNSENRIRSNNSSLNPLDAPVVLVGDSFTYGTDANDGETYPAQLEKELGVPVANLGVTGYCPLQALLKLKKRIAQFPHAKIVVLGIMYSDLLRLSSSNRLVYYGHTKNKYGLKPYMKSGEIIPIDPRSTQGFQQMMEGTLESFDKDYWARPVAKFPYTYSLVKALSSNSFRLRTLIAAARIMHQPDYHYIFDMPDTRENYHYLLQHYADFAKERGLKPVLVLIPENIADITTGDLLVEEAKKSFADTFTYVAVGQGIDMSRYILRGDTCTHPSKYGYKMIAETVAAAIKNLGNRTDK